MRTPAWRLPAEAPTPSDLGADPRRAPAVLLDLHDLERRYGEQVVFRQVSWRVRAGEIGAIMGPNGAGKTTLVQVAAGLLAPDGGEVRVAGRVAGAARPGWRRLVGYVGHRPLVYPDLSALENLVFFGRLYGVDAAEARRRAEALLDRLGLAAAAHRPAGRLSRGMAQRLEVARSLMHRPILWLWDEPFTGLDAGAARLLEDLLREHAAAGGAAVVVLHEPERALALADRVLLLAGGNARDVPARALDAGVLAAWLAGTPAAPTETAAGGAMPGVARAGVAGGPPGPAAATQATRGVPGPAAWGPVPPEGAAESPRQGGARAVPAGPALALLVARDWRQEWRRREGLASLATFVLLVGLALAFALDPARHALGPLMGGLLWVAFYFAAMLLFGRAFAQDADRGTLDGLLLAPVDRSVLYLARVASQGLQMLLLELVLVPVVLAWLGYRGAAHWGGFVLAMGLGTLGLAVVGTLLGALTAPVRGREALLPVLLFPMTAPVLLGAVQAAGAALAGVPEQAALWFRVLAVYDTMFLVAGALLFDFVVAR